MKQFNNFLCTIKLKPTRLIAILFVDDEMRYARALQGECIYSLFTG
jgi:hypothetical protein